MQEDKVMIGDDIGDDVAVKASVAFFTAQSKEEADEIIGGKRRISVDVWTYDGKWYVRKYMGSKTHELFYRVETELQARKVVISQSRVKKRIWVWFGSLYALAGLSTVALILIARLPLWLVIIFLPIVEIVTYIYIQNHYYVTIHAGGKREQPPDKAASSNFSVIIIIAGILAILAAIRLMVIYDILEVGLGKTIFVLVLLIAIFGLIARVPKKGIKLAVSPPVEKPEDLLPEAAAYEIDYELVPADVLGLGGRFPQIVNPFIRLKVAVRKAPRFDLDIQTTAICKNGAELILVLGISGELPFDDPFHFIESYKVEKPEDAEALLDNPAKTAARKLIGAVETDQELTGAAAEFGGKVLPALFGSSLTQAEIKSLQEPNEDSRVYVPLVALNLNHVSINVDLTEEQKKQRAKLAQEQADRSAEEFEAETLKRIAFKNYIDYRNNQTPITITEAIRMAQSERGKISSINKRIEFNPEQLDIIAAGVQMLIAASQHKGSP